MTWKKRIHSLVFVAFWVGACGAASAACLDGRPQRGVNLSGAEFGHTKLPGVLNKDYIYPSYKDLVFFQAQGANVVRVPFRWERIQRRINGPLEPSDLAQLQAVVNWGKSLNLCIVLDLHNFGAYQGQVLGSAELPTTAFLDLWTQLAQTFNDTDVAAFGLMNEPSAIAVQDWFSIAQQAVLHLRKAGALNLLLVGSGRWSGAHEWHKNFAGTSAAEAFKTFQDPLNRFAIELHQYADANYSGTTSSCIDPVKLKDIMSKVTVWALQEKKQVFLGEFGTAASPECITALREILNGMQATTAWLGWTYWSAGPWWGNYAFSIQPQAGMESAQLALLRTYFKN